MNHLAIDSRPANIEGTGRITARDLVINSLRMRPDRIIVGEVRGPEALDMLQAINTGHEGSLTGIPKPANLATQSRPGRAARRWQGRRGWRCRLG
jgi:pilus assembly protein CpaF